MASASKEDYLKKYLSDKYGESKKKKKKKSHPTKDASGFKILDDDVDFKSLMPSNLKNTLDEDIEVDNPTVAEFIDERPKELQILEKYRNDKKWKLLDEDDAGSSANEHAVRNRNRHDSDSDNSIARKTSRSKHTSTKQRHDSSDSDDNRTAYVSTTKSFQEIMKSSNSGKINSRKRHDSDSDPSPVRRERNDSDSDQSLKRNTKGNDSDLEVEHKNSSRKRTSDREDDSPVRKHTRLDTKESGSARRKGNAKNVKGKKRTSRFDDEGAAPTSQSDIAVKMKDKRLDSDISPKRSKRGYSDSDSDQAIDRNRKSRIESNKYSNKNKKRFDSDSDHSPKRNQRHDSDFDQSPKRNRKKQDSDSDNSPKRNRWQDSESDQTKKRRDDHGSNISRSDSKQNLSNSKEDKMTKTLGGAKAGLSSAKEVRRETMSLKRKEDERFDQVGDEQLGRHSKTVFRDKSGKRRDLVEEQKKESEEAKKKAKKDEKYQQWGKGLAQSSQQESNVEDAVYEMSKPMTRYKDDEDLDNMLKEQARDGDPMAAFLTKKKKQTKGNKPELPRYSGRQPPPNRLNIWPGYRWDGVDRSNGFESKLFASKTNKKAIEEIAYKWSTEDM